MAGKGEVTDDQVVPAIESGDGARHAVPGPVAWPAYADSGPESAQVVEPLNGLREAPGRMLWSHIDPSRMRSRVPKGIWHDQFDFCHTRRSVVGLTLMLVALITSLAVLNAYWLIGWCLMALLGLIVFVHDTVTTTTWMRLTGHDREVDVL